MFKKSITDRIKSFISKITSDSSQDKKQQSILAFKSLISEYIHYTPLIEHMCRQFEKNIQDYQINFNHVTDDYINNIIWLTIYSNTELLTLHINEDNIGDCIIYGLTGTGKTSFILSMIKSKNIVNIYTHNNESISLIKKYCPTTTIHFVNKESNCRNVIYETSNMKDVIDILSVSPSLKLYIVCEATHSIESVISINQDLKNFKISKVNGVVITKVDFINKNSDSKIKKYDIISIPYILNTKCIACTCLEISVRDRYILSGSYLTSFITKSLLNKDVNNQDDVNDILNTHSNYLDLHAYKLYLNFILNSDTDKFMNFLDTFDSLNAHNINTKEHKKILEKMKTKTIKEKIMKSIKIQIYIIDSMRKNEKQKPHIIDHKRAKRIAKGSGTVVQDVFNTIAGFNQYKNTIKNMDYNQILGNIK